MVFVKNYFSIGDDGRMPHDEIVVTRCLGNAAEGKACADADMTGPEDSFVFKHDSAHTDTSDSNQSRVLQCCSCFCRRGWLNLCEGFLQPFRR